MGMGMGMNGLIQVIRRVLLLVLKWGLGRRKEKKKGEIHLMRLEYEIAMGVYSCDTMEILGSSRRILVM